MTGRHADIIQAGYIASEIVHRMVVPGGEVRRERGEARGGERGESEEGRRGRRKGGGRVRG